MSDEVIGSGLFQSFGADLLRLTAQQLRDRTDVAPNETDGVFAAAEWLDQQAAELDIS